MEVGRYTLSEVTHATGMKRQVIQYRAKKLGIHTRRGYTYEDIKRVVAYSSLAKVHTRPAKVAELKMKLKNDGFKTT